MSNPDTQAAELSWRGKPLPIYGARVRVRHTTGENGQTRTASETVTVDTVSLTGDVLTINNRIRLDAARLSDGWQQVLSPTANERAIPTEPVPDQPDTSAPVSSPQREGAPDPNPTDLVGMQQRWRWVKDKLTEVKAITKALEAERSRLAEQIVEECIAQGLDAPLQIGGRTWYFGGTKHMAYRVNDDGEKYTSEDVVAALKDAGLDTGIVRETYNHQSLEAFLRERDEQGLAMPPELDAVVMLEPRPDVRSVAGSRAKVKGAVALRAFAAQRAE